MKEEGKEIGLRYDRFSLRKEVFQSFVKDSSYGFGLVDRDGKILYINQKFKELMYGDLEKVQNLKDLFTLIRTEFINKNQIFMNWLASLENQKISEPRFEDFIIEHEKGIKKYLSFIIIPLEDNLVLIIFEDKTKKVKTEELIKVLEDRFYHSNRLETIGYLAGGIIHNFSDLLTVILGNAEIGMMNLLRSNPIYEVLYKIREAAQNGSELIKILLDFNQILKMKPKSINVNELIQKISRIPIKFIKDDIELKINSIENLNSIYADPGSIIQIFVMILTNAHLIIPLGGTILIEMINRELDDDFCLKYPFIIPGDYIQISIIFSGKEVDSSSLSYIFNKGFKNSEIGNIYHLVKRNSGYIFIYDKLDSNEIMVKIFFPVCKDILTSVAVGSPNYPISTKQKTILLAEDEGELRRILDNFLRGLRYKTILSSNGDEALKFFLTHLDEIDLVILDLILHGMNGIDLYKKIRSYSLNIPCIIITGQRDEKIDRYFDDKRETVIIKKPFDLKLLEKEISRLLFLPK